MGIQVRALRSESGRSRASGKQAVLLLPQATDDGEFGGRKESSSRTVDITQLLSFIVLAIV